MITTGGTSNNSSSTGTRPTTGAMILPSSSMGSGHDRAFNPSFVSTRMLSTEVLQLLVELGHPVRPVVVATPSVEDFLGTKDHVDTTVVGHPSRVNTELVEKSRLESKNKSRKRQKKHARYTPLE